MIHHNSLTALEKVRPVLKKWQQLVFDEIKKYGELTSKDLAFRLNTQMHKISGRLTELKDLELIEEVGRRNGCAIFRIKEAEKPADPGVQARMNF